MGYRLASLAQHITSSTFVENPANMMDYIVHSLYVTQASVVMLYSEVYVAFNQNAGDTSLSFENV
ncbi:hypothetical protein T01_7793 [Trichinella spiralis]|uniref:Uncharacterized protein n=1 Tax=Trichinella spiralis TaxID=6334 RepID=A0A0V1BS73_TRISP|nr:hypothetical protein T01_7793 [Trichinella spiralis]